MGDRSSSITRTRQSAAVPSAKPQALFDTHAEVSLDFEVVRQAARQKYTRPFLILDTAIVRNKIRACARPCRPCARTTRSRRTPTGAC